jgi:hypothetical protein
MIKSKRLTKFASPSKRTVLDSQQFNAVYSSPRMKRRYEVWFLRFALAAGSGAWWFRYLLFNLGRQGCSADPSGMPVQVWATWFPRQGKPQTFIEGFPVEALALSPRRQLPFSFRIADCGIEHSDCWGNLQVGGHSISWKLRYHSNFGAVLSHKGWIGFCQSPHSNATFSGEIVFDGRSFTGEALGFGIQGHNCGYRHRSYWRWLHAYFRNAQGAPSTFEALVYDMPFGLTFCNAIWWHNAKPTTLRRIQELEIVNDPAKLRWALAGTLPDGSPLQITAEAFPPEIHHLPYAKTDCSGVLPVTNASLARAQVSFGRDNEALDTASNCVLEMGGT